MKKSNKLILVSMALLSTTTLLGGCMKHTKVNPHPKKINVAKRKGLLAKNRKDTLKNSNTVASYVGGFGSRTTGGSGANKKTTYVVTNGKQFKNALQKKLRRNQPRKIILDGKINLAEDKDGNHLNQLSYIKRAKNTEYNNQDYISVFNHSTKKYAKLAQQRKALEKARIRVSNIQKQHINLNIPSNTTIIGDSQAKVAGTQLHVNRPNIIIRNLHIESPRDDFPRYSQSQQQWSPAYDAIKIGAKANNIWLDHNTFTDKPYLYNNAKHLNAKYELMNYFIGDNNGKNITISNNEFDNHDKVMKLNNTQATIAHNKFIDDSTNMPQVNNSKVDILDNAYAGDSSKPYAFKSAWELQNHAHVYASDNGFIFNTQQNKNSHLFKVLSKDNTFSNNNCTVNQRKLTKQHANDKKAKPQDSFNHVIKHLARDFGNILK